MILANSAKCLNCGDSIYSASVHDYSSCSCGEVFVDGGQEYIRHGFKSRVSYANTSIEIPDEVYEECIKQLEWCDETGRNNLGRLCAVFRALRDTGYLDDSKS